MKTIFKVLMLLLVLFAGNAMAKTCPAKSDAQNWGAASSWVGCGVPSDGDRVVIPSGSTVTLNEDTQEIADLTVATGGVLLGSGGNKLHLQGPGNLTNNGTITLGNAEIEMRGDFVNTGTFNAGSDKLKLDGDFANTGTFNAQTGLVEFDGNAAQTITGNVTFNDLKVDNGSSNGLVLNGNVIVNGSLSGNAVSGGLVKLSDTCPVDYTLTSNSGNTVQHSCPLPPGPIAEYRFDEAAWTGATNEVKDSSGNGNHAQAFNGATTAVTSAAISGNPGTCGYGVFANSYVQTSLPNFTSNFTMTGWIRSSNITPAGQRIVIDDQNNSGGYGFSLSDGTSGRLRFYSRGINPVILDSSYTIANNTWYFVAAVADITNKKRTIYVYDASGALLNQTTEVAWTSGTWGADNGPVSIGGETNASSESANRFRGTLDEIRVYGAALNQAALTAIAKQTHPCTVTGPDHYELSLPTTGISCLPTTVTVTACATGVPCNPMSTLSGKTALLKTTAGALSATTVTFNASGVASTTLSYPAASDGAVATLTLSDEQAAAINARKYCPDGASCVVGDSGSTTFNTAGLIFATAVNAGEASFSSQTAGVDFGPYWLRAVKTNTATKACEAALTAAHPVNFSYQCLDPTSCSSGNLLKVGSLAAVASTGATVNLAFDANGNASLGNFSFADVGQIKINVSATAGGATLTGSTKEAAGSRFVVKPYSLVLTDITQTAAPHLSNPAAVDAAGSKFVKAGENFSATVTSVNASCAASLAGYTTLSSIAATCITPNYGQETTPETVSLSYALVPGLGLSANPALNNAAAFGAFSGGSVTGTTFNWGEVGIITLTPSVGDGNYLGAGNPGGTTSGKVGRFYPDHFDVSVNLNGTMAAACPAGGFTYTGQPMGYATAPALTIKPMGAAIGGSVTQNYQGGFQKLSATAVTVTVPTADASQFGKNGVTKTPLVATMSAGALANTSGTMTYTLNAGDQFTYLRNANALIGPFTTAIPLVVTEVAESEVSAVGSLVPMPQILSPTGTAMRYGRARMLNAYGSESLDLPVVFRAEYLASTGPGNAWSVNTVDSCTNATLSFAPIGTANITSNTCVLEPGNNSGKGCAAALTPAQTNRRYLEAGVTGVDSNGVAGFAGNFNLWLRAPGATHVGSIDITATVDSWLQYPWTGATATNPSARATFGIYKSPLIYRRENY
ncbi:MAG: hypothetical protein GZ093_17280 [Rhodoferax sp.]|nr:hypothetical protein [Rhodoferax sp.]